MNCSMLALKTCKHIQFTFTTQISCSTKKILTVKMRLVWCVPKMEHSIKFSNKHEVNASEIFNKLTQAYSNHVLSLKIAEDRHRPGRPITFWTVDKVTTLDRRFIVRNRLNLSNTLFIDLKIKKNILLHCKY